MHITRHGSVLLVVLVACIVFAHSQQAKKPIFTVEIVAARGGGVDLKISSVRPYPVSIRVCDTPQRLDGLWYYLEQLNGVKWERLKFHVEGAVLGDLPGKYLEIGAHSTVYLPANFSPHVFGIRRGTKLRIIVLAYRTKTDVSVIGNTVTHVLNEESSLISAPFTM